MHVTALQRLLQSKAERTWDKAVIWVRGRQPIAIYPDDMTFGLVSGTESTPVLEVSSQDAVDPFHNPQLDGLQPKVCTHTIHIDIVDVLCVDYVQYPKIITALQSASPIITMQRVP